MRTFVRAGVRSILVIRLYFVGDVLLSTPVLAALRASFPLARVDVLIKKRALGVLEGNPHLDRVVLYDEADDYHAPRRLLSLALRLRRARYDLAVDLTGDHRSSLLMAAADPGFRVGLNHAGMGFLLDRRIPYRAEGHVIDHLLSSVEKIGVLAAERSPVLVLGGDELARARALLEGAGVNPASPFLALSPGANWVRRRWPADRFGKLAALARERLGCPSVVTGSGSDVPLADSVVAGSGGAAVSLAGSTSLRALAGVARLAAVFVGNDSGPMHVAASQGTPVVGLFGPNTPERYAPRGAPSRVLWARPPCSPCSQRKCVREADPCMEAIAVTDVLDAVCSLFEAGRER